MSDFQQMFLASTPSFPNAACSDINNPDQFYPETKEELANVLPAIRKLCGGCVHQTECLQFALDESIGDGIWGGLTPAERKRIRPLKKRTYTSDLGIKVEQLRRDGLTFAEIAKRLNTSLSACLTAHGRWKRKRGTA